MLHFIHPHTQVVIIGHDEAAAELYRTAVRPLRLNAAVVRFDADKAVAQNLPPALAATIPNLPGLNGERSFAVVCSGFSCQPPIFDPEGLGRALGSRKRSAAESLTGRSFRARPNNRCNESLHGWIHARSITRRF